MTWKLVGAAAMALAVAACGTREPDRTTGGAAAGAATGAGIGALGGPVGALAGAAIGAGAGAVTGATTSPSDVNLGRPLWSDPEVRTPLDDDRRGSSRRVARSGYDGAASGGRASVREAQRELAQRGFDPGSADGIWGPQTSRAAMEFQRANNLEATGRLDSRTMQALNVSDRGSRAAQMRDSRTSDRDRAYMGGGMVGDTRTGAPGTSTAPSTSGGMGTTGSRMDNSTTTGVGGGGIGTSTPSTGPGGTSNVGSGNQPGVGGTSQTR
jgi:peptidoglycan hydrolase-like protein with peptidoglycan-binding domain